MTFGPVEQSAVEKPMVYWDQEAQRYVYRASALMSCQNALCLARQGVDGMAPPEKMQKRFDAGHDHEEMILAKLARNFGIATYAHQQEIEINVGKSAMLRGHLDGLALLTNGMKVSSVDGVECDALVTQGADGTVRDWIAVVDAKAFAPSTMKEWINKRFETDLGLHYLWQQSSYLYAGAWDAIVMAVYDKLTGDIRADVYTAEWIKARLPKATLFQRVMWVELHYNDVFDQPCSPKMWPCPFYTLHPDAIDESGDKAVGDVELQRLAGKRLAVDAVIAKAKADKEKADDDIRSHLGNKKVAPIKFADCTVSSYYSSSSNTDWSGIAAALGVTVDEAKNQFAKKTTSKTLSIKVVSPQAK